MKRLFLIILLSITAATLSGCGSGTFTINNEKFQATDICDGTGTLEIYMENGEVHAKAQGDIKTHMIKNGFPSAWCHGLTHQYTGTVKRSGYTFESDPNDPLKFQVDRDKGYHYISGKGVVTDPDGKVTTFP
jgi:hypothetical protein